MKLIMRVLVLPWVCVLAVLGFSGGFASRIRRHGEDAIDWWADLIDSKGAQ